MSPVSLRPSPNADRHQRARHPSQPTFSHGRGSDGSGHRLRSHLFPAFGDGPQGIANVDSPNLSLDCWASARTLKYLVLSGYGVPVGCWAFASPIPSTIYSRVGVPVARSRPPPPPFPGRSLSVCPNLHVNSPRPAGPSRFRHVSVRLSASTHPCHQTVPTQCSMSNVIRSSPLAASGRRYISSQTQAT